MKKYKPYTDEEILAIVLEYRTEIFSTAKAAYAYMPYAMTAMYQKIIDFVTTPEIMGAFDADNDKLNDGNIYAKYDFYRGIMNEQQSIIDMLKKFIKCEKIQPFTKKRIKELKTIMKKTKLNNFGFYTQIYNIGYTKGQSYEQLKSAYRSDDEKKQLKQQFLRYIKFTQIDKRKQSQRYNTSRDLDKDVYYETVEGRIAKIKGYLFNKYRKKCKIDKDYKAIETLPEGVFVKPMKLINKTIPKANESMKLLLASLFEGIKDCHMVIDTNFKIAYDPYYNNNQDTDGDKASNYSCMSGEGRRAEEFYGKIDGCKVVRWELDDGTQVGRCIMYEWNGKRHFIRIYGQYDYHRTMINMLEAQMSQQDLFGRDKYIDGIKLETSMNYDTPTMYLDGECYGLREENDKFYMVANNYDIDCKTTSGDTIDYLMEDYNTCDNCGHREHNDEGYWIDDNFYCCSNCAEEAGYHQCERCGEWVHEDDAIYIEGSGYYCCESCTRAQGYEFDNYYKEWVDNDDLGDTDDGRYLTTKYGAAEYYGVDEDEVEWDSNNYCWKRPEQEQQNEGEENGVQEQ